VSLTRKQLINLLTDTAYATAAGTLYGINEFVQRFPNNTFSNKFLNFVESIGVDKIDYVNQASNLFGSASTTFMMHMFLEKMQPDLNKSISQEKLLASLGTATACYLFECFQSLQHHAPIDMTDLRATAVGITSYLFASTAVNLVAKGIEKYREKPSPSNEISSITSIKNCVRSFLQKF